MSDKAKSNDGQSANEVAISVDTKMSNESFDSERHAAESSAVARQAMRVVGGAVSDAAMSQVLKNFEIIGAESVKRGISAAHQSASEAVGASASLNAHPVKVTADGMVAGVSSKINEAVLKQSIKGAIADIGEMLLGRDLRAPAPKSLEKFGSEAMRIPSWMLFLKNREGFYKNLPEVPDGRYPAYSPTEMMVVPARKN